MTQPGSTSASTSAGSAAQEQPASQFTKPARELVALVLLAANAVLLFFAVVDLMVPYEFDHDGFTGRAAATFNGFVGLMPVALPLLAVLITTHVAPRTPRARLVTFACLVEYGVSALFGVVCLFASFAGRVDSGLVRLGLEEFVRNVAMLCVLGAAGYLVLRVWQGLYAAPRPAAPPMGVIPTGYPQPGAQPQAPAAGYGQPATYGQPAGYPQPAPGHGQPGPSGYGQPAPYGQPTQASYPAFGDQTVVVPPVSGDPATGFGEPGGYGSAQR